MIEKKSQNCVKAAIAFACRNCKWQLLYALLLLTAFVYTNVIVNYTSNQNIETKAHISIKLILDRQKDIATYRAATSDKDKKYTFSSFCY